MDVSSWHIVSFSAIQWTLSYVYFCLVSYKTQDRNTICNFHVLMLEIGVRLHHNSRPELQPPRTPKAPTLSLPKTSPTNKTTSKPSYPSAFPSSLRQHPRRLLLRQNNLLDRILLMLEILRIVIRMRGEEELYLSHHRQTSFPNARRVGQANKRTLIPIEPLRRLDARYLFPHHSQYACLFPIRRDTTCGWIWCVPVSAARLSSG